jgi:hypothetical protein
MNNTTLQLKVKQRLNKLDSSDYDNFECWQIVEAFNKGQLQWCRRQIEGNNIAKTGSESTTVRIDDLQVILKEVPIDLYNHPIYFDADLPADYLGFKRIDTYGSTDCCPDRMHVNVTYLAEEENISILLDDYLKKPSFEWGETFCTLIGNKLRIYTNGEFSLIDTKLMYYRMPRMIQITGCLDPYTLQVATQDVTCEFKEDIAEILVDEAVKILSGDIESITQYQLAQSSEQTNT